MNIDFSLIKNIRYLGKLLDKNLNNKLKEYGLTSQQGRIIFYVVNRYKNGQETNQFHIEKEFDLSKSTVSEMLKRLKSNGFIEKKSTDENKKTIIPLEKGICLEEVFYKSRDELIKKLLKGIPPNEQEQTKQGLLTMIKNMEEASYDEEN